MTIQNSSARHIGRGPDKIWDYQLPFITFIPITVLGLIGIGAALSRADISFVERVGLLLLGLLGVAIGVQQVWIRVRLTDDD